MFNTILEYFCCPSGLLDFDLSGQLIGKPGYFRFGPGILCYGRNSVGASSSDCKAEGTDLTHNCRVERECCQVPFQADEILDNLRCERYVDDRPTVFSRRFLRDAYYLVRPVLPVGIRKHLQRMNLHGRNENGFPDWPVDCTADTLIRKLTGLSMEAKGIACLPFVWFWPNGHSSCAIMTHDIETVNGRDFCPALMDVDDSFGIKSSFQVIPEGRYAVSQRFLNEIRGRGFEVNVHDLNHDGLLFRDFEQFRSRATRINWYAREFGARGFRSGALYRNLNWYHEFSFSYDMSVPNVGRLEAQPGGCCTVMPYFIGDILELPVTMTQDYALFNYLGTYSLDLWRQQIDLVRQQNGLISFIVHPDYLRDTKALRAYSALLQHLSELRSQSDVWLAPAGEVDRWWRQRNKMTLVRAEQGWRVEGEGRERARVAYAMLDGGRLFYSFEQTRAAALA